MVNGYGQSLAAFARTAGPTVASLVFAWSEVNGEQYSPSSLLYTVYT